MLLLLLAQDLTDATYDKWRDYIRPKPEENRWMDIRWRTTFGDAVAEARQKGLPILLWAMNGHPLACT